jgi:glutamate-1-semialdehyde aminotransferase
MARRRGTPRLIPTAVMSAGSSADHAAVKIARTGASRVLEFEGHPFDVSNLLFGNAQQPSQKLFVQAHPRLPFSDTHAAR